MFYIIIFLICCPEETTRILEEIFLWFDTETSFFLPLTSVEQIFDVSRVLLVLRSASFHCVSNWSNSLSEESSRVWCVSWTSRSKKLQ